MSVHNDFIAPYNITGCGDKQRLVESHIRALKVYVSRAAVDSANGVRGQHGFHAFFKSNTSIAFVRNILLAVQLGRATSVKLTEEGEFVDSAPQIICATEGLDESGPLTELQPFKSCSSEEGVIAFYFAITPYIVLCPIFWTLPADSQPNDLHCGRVDPNNQFAGGNVIVGNGPDRRISAQDALIGYQVYYLFHELVHFYLEGSSLGGNLMEPEVYDWNNCLALGTSTSIRNPMNYQLYLASESTPIYNLEIF